MVMLLLLISFIAGILTILAPCVFPLLPVILGGSLANHTHQRSRPYIIAVSLALSIILFTLLLKVSTALIAVPPTILNGISGIIIIALGFVTIFPGTWERLMIHYNWQALSQRFLGAGTTNHNALIGPILIGVALGPIFSSCSPTYAFILASILPKDFLSGFIYLIVYTVGLVGALLVVTLVGRRLTKRLGWLVNTHGKFRKVLGIIFVILGILIISGKEVAFETWLANRLPFDETRVEQVLLAQQQPSTYKTIAPTRTSVLNVQSTPAPALKGLTSWINSSPLTLSQLKGKVVLVDFWTYSCVNCNRTLPYLKTWYSTYSSKGLVIIGVHTPEFAFEHVAANVQNFVTNNDITYPVALDNNYDTWNAFNNDSWPAEYLIDKQGNVRYISLGEGDYNVTEEAIQELLGINAALKTPTSNVPIGNSQTPETYFGTNRDSNYNGTPDLTNGTHTFTPTATSNLSLNNWTLGGNWDIEGESITSQSDNATLTFNVSAKDVYVVGGSASGQPLSATVGLSSDAGQYGSDAPNGNLTLAGSSIYHIVSLNVAGSTTVTMTVPKGATLYTFTFGS